VEALQSYLKEQTKIQVKNFIAAGREDGLPFDDIYRNLQKAKSDQGLSNSEAALAAGLWGAHQSGAEIAHVGLTSFFPFNGPAVGLEKLRKMVLESDGLLVSGPVYFGDRGSLAQSFFDFMRDDPEVQEKIQGKVYGGISVGAKRNGGQETTLIYQLVDAVNLNMLAVGNDSETTSQYGGTVIAGDVGTMAEDDYGLKTSIGTGRRIADVTKIISRSKDNKLTDKTRISVWLLQDQDQKGRDYVDKLSQEVEANNPNVVINVMDFTKEDIFRCIACDVCPVKPGTPDEYRCIIKSRTDLFVRKHAELIECDAIIIAAYSPSDRVGLQSVYQQFIERTRYLRRDDYLIGDRLVAPLVISELNARQNLHIRILTSFIRHNSVMHHPLIGMEIEDRIINWDTLVEHASSFAAMAEKITVGRLSSNADEYSDTHYNPVGYHISAGKRLADDKCGKIKESDDARRGSVRAEKEQRIARDSQT
jgi:multimeric flavodoxin WrbA